MLKYKQLGFSLKEVNDDDGSVAGTFSTADIDRHGEVVDQKSWELGDYLKNPTVLWAHDHSQPAIGKTVALGFDNEGNLAGTIQFAVKEYPFANTLYQLVKGGFIKAFSVGFISEEQDTTANGETILKKNRLLEISLVNVPANALALAKSKGIDIKPVIELEAKQNEYTKEGRVLSKKNREAVERAVAALQDVIAADDASRQPDKGQVQERSKPQLQKLGDTRRITVRQLNRAVRALLNEKRILTR
jgi:HK97 family phage prohead protease